MSTMNPQQQPQPMMAQQGAPEPEYGEEEGYEEGSHRFLMFNAVPSSLISAVFHAVLLVALALVTLPPNEPPPNNEITVLDSPAEELEEMEEIIPEIDLKDLPDPDEVTDPVLDRVALPDAPEDVMEVVETPTMDLSSSVANIEIVEFSNTTAPKSDLMQSLGGITGTGLSGRGSAARGQMVKKYGGNAASEAAVAAALKWLAEHQLPDGGWSFDHSLCPRCGGKCSHPGSMTGDQGRNGATAMALLPFLGAGQTHVEGEYQGVVKQGLYFLMTRQDQKTGSFHEAGGSMYSHGLCSIVICEAYAMTHDRALMLPAQGSLNFIIYAQDPVGGGWRYAPRSPGDTSVVGWQLMALKSGHMAYLNVPPLTINKAMRFLDAVQSNSGANYGYTSPGAGPGTTAVGLLCRMYLGWKKDHPALDRGVEYLAKRGPSVGGANGPATGNMYYNYYATQVMRHYGGDSWEAWNTVMRDYLVLHQAKQGHEKGSWQMAGDHGSERGGRLYCTSMATMVLEVYYRHMPIYQEAASTEEFPL